MLPPPPLPSPLRTPKLRRGGALALLLSCGPLLQPQPPAADDAATYAAALAAIAAEPVAGATACADIVRPALRADCTSAAAEALAATDAAAAAGLCAGLPAGSGRDECHFQVAERSADVRRCADAGDFADDCRLHRLSADLRNLLPASATDLATAEATLAPHLRDYGFAPDDMRPWSAAFRYLLARELPLDRGRCDAVTDPDRAEACRHTALALFEDMLNHARDTTGLPCDGGPLPPRLRYRPDPDLDAILARRMATDLCP